MWNIQTPKLEVSVVPHLSRRGTHYTERPMLNNTEKYWSFQQWLRADVDEGLTTIDLTTGLSSALAYSHQWVNCCMITPSMIASASILCLSVTVVMCMKRRTYPSI